jgi:hypothetical protein
MAGAMSRYASLNLATLSAGGLFLNNQLNRCFLILGVDRSVAMPHPLKLRISTPGLLFHLAGRELQLKPGLYEWLKLSQQP